MPGNFKYDDFRVQKTKQALISAMSKLLGLRNFNRITVNDLCDEANISRATFYSHFQDKYDFLKYWLINYQSLFMFDRETYEDYERHINDQVKNNFKIIKNFLENADSETYELLCDHMLLLFDFNIDKENSQKNIVFSRFCSGGVMNYLMWFVKNKSKSDFSFMNPYCYNILLNLHNFINEQN